MPLRQASSVVLDVRGQDVEQEDTKVGMNKEVFAEWLGRTGYRVLRTSTTCWYEVGPRVLQAFPYHLCIAPSSEELSSLFRRERLIAVRYSAQPSVLQGRLSYHVVCTDGQYSIEHLPKKARYDVRKGLSCGTVGQISLRRLAEEGWLLREETLQRQGRTRAETRDWWMRLCAAADGLPGFEAWGITCRGHLAACLLACMVDNWCYILYQQSASAYLKEGVNNALAYAFTVQALGRVGISAVFYGLHSLDAPASVDEFKFRMGYTAEAVRQRVVFHPAIAPVLNASTHALVDWLHRRFPCNATLAKTEGMIRFYLEGKKPLSRQSIPAALADVEVT